MLMYTSGTTGMPKLGQQPNKLFSGALANTGAQQTAER